MPEIAEIIRTKRKTIALVIQPDGRLIVRAPQRATLKQIRQMVEQHTDWITAKQGEMGTRFAPWTFTAGSKFPYLGQLYPLRIIPGAAAGLRFDGSAFLLAESALPGAAALFGKWYQAQARRLFAERVQFFAARHGFKYEKLRLSSARTRWGSCSSRGALSLTWRLVMAPLDVVDYVVVHELVHLRHPNHSQEFWHGVETILPDYKTRRKWLKVNGAGLHWP